MSVAVKEEVAESSSTRTRTSNAACNESNRNHCKLETKESTTETPETSNDGNESEGENNGENRNRNRNKNKNKKGNATKNENVNESPCQSQSQSQSQTTFIIHRKITITPKAKAVMYMALSMAVHFAGHEFARAPTTSMFTSKDVGFQSAAALPLAVGFVSPFSVFLLWSFARMLRAYGPRYALIRSTVAFATFMFTIGLLLHQTHLRVHQHDMSRNWSKYFIFCLFVYQSANVQFLYTQHWSFLGSILTPEEGKVWFAPIAGIGSITSTLAAANVHNLVDRIGLVGLLCTAAVVIGSSAIFADSAYAVAAENGFEPKHDAEKETESKGTSRHRKTTQPGDNGNVVQTTLALFRRTPILGALFSEVILQQCLSSIINFQFMVKVKDAILDDEVRAGWTGGCYAWINGISGLLQFMILPIITKRVDPSWLWLFMPSVMLLLTSMQIYQYNVSLYQVAFTFLSMKTMEYSLRGQVSEMVFASLDYESRYLGKEAINLFANRLGKSGMAVSLFLLTTYIEKDHSELRDFFKVASSTVAFIWLMTTIRLTAFLKQKSIR